MTPGPIIAVGAFVLMEPATALVHRLVMHGRGWVLHRSHHRVRPAAGFELNDVYPVIFAVLTMTVMAIGFHSGGHVFLVPGAVGVTAYGVAYGFVHEVYIHQRINFPWQFGVLERRKAAHLIHHRWGQAPFGMLSPVVPGRLRISNGAGDVARSRAAA